MAAVCSLAIPPTRASSLAARSFRPGQLWNDTSGKPIYAHGSSIIALDGHYYLYGENKEFTSGGNDVWTFGIRCYRSRDLYSWDDLGLIIRPNLRNKASPLNPARFLDRPHIIYNPRTAKFVCWIKMLSDPIQTRVVLTADRITGPYQLIAQDIRPVDMSAGDFDLVASPDDGKAYMYFERVHSEMICADLDPNYTGFTGHYSSHLPRPGPPSVREGLAYFWRDGRHYLASSGTTGYFPNPSEVAVAQGFHGPWTTLGDLHPTDRSRTSFNSQISSVFRHPGKRDLYIAIADRWMGELDRPGFADGTLSAEVRLAFAKRFARPPQPLTARETELMATLGSLKVNTSQARHVWLPIRFDSDRPVIEWRDEWSLDEFD